MTLNTVKHMLCFILRHVQEQGFVVVVGALESACRHGKTAQAGQLESALLERNKECATLRRERNEAQQKLQDRTKLGYLWGSPLDILEYT